LSPGRSGTLGSRKISSFSTQQGVGTKDGGREKVNISDVGKFASPYSEAVRLCEVIKVSVGKKECIQAGKPQVYIVKADRGGKVYFRLFSEGISIVLWRGSGLLKLGGEVGGLLL